MQKIITHLWFNDQAEEAAALYVSLFDNSRILETRRYTEELSAASGQPTGSVMTVSFELAGQRFFGLNGGPQFPFTEAISLYVNCETQEEVDRLWEKLSDGGEPGPCGWLKDRYGVSWQIVPTVLERMMSDQDAEKSARAMKAMLQMSKLDINALQAAFDGR